MKIKELLSNDENSLRGLKIKTANGIVGHYFELIGNTLFIAMTSNWNSDDPLKNGTELFPQFISSRDEILELEILEDKQAITE